MKKLLLSSLMAVSGLFAMNAAETTIVFSDIYGEATISGIDATGGRLGNNFRLISSGVNMASVYRKNHGIAMVYLVREQPFLIYYGIRIPLHF